MKKKSEQEKNPQNKRILKEYKDYLTDEEKDALKKDALVSPRYRTSKPVGQNSRGDEYYDHSYAPEFKKNSMNLSSESYDAGAGRGRVNPKTSIEAGRSAKGLKKGGSVTRGDGIAKRGHTKGKMV